MCDFDRHAGSKEDGLLDYYKYTRKVASCVPPFVFVVTCKAKDDLSINPGTFDKHVLNCCWF